MSQKTYVGVTAVVFLIIALFHLTRIIAGWDVLLDNWVIPQWFSWLGLVIAGFLAYTGFSQCKGE